MAEKTSERIVGEIAQRYSDRTKKARAHDEAAKQYLPGGDTRTATYFQPHPAYMERGEGCWLFDCDGNRYLDFLNNYTSLIHGHAHPRVVEVAQAQMAKGTVLGAPGEIQYRHAAHLCGRVPSLEMVRYCNSGTEATLFAMRAARAFTGKDVFIKMDGGYHGSHDFVDVNVIPDYMAPGRPTARVEHGVPASVLTDVRIAPFNDLEAVEDLLKEHRGQVAAVMVEPLLGAGGGIRPQPGYLRGLRDLADRYDVLLIFDEIITFRLSTGGMQLTEGVTPDITSLGKIIGGGFPIGAFGGRKEIMARFDPAHPQSLMHSGTFNGNNITLAAGLATLEMYDQAEADRINALGERLARGFDEAFQQVGLQARAGGLGSVVLVHWGERTPRNSKEAAVNMGRAGWLPRLLHLELMNRGVYSASRGMFAISTPMTEKEVDEAVAGLRGALELLRPFAEEAVPSLVAH
jgi:glutamate-1-semialdehyde 2,1-aminomutase